MPRQSKAAKAEGDRKQRRAEIMNTVADSMKALSARKRMDWGRETPETIAAWGNLDETMYGYIQGERDREDVKAAYKTCANLHTVEKGAN